MNLPSLADIEAAATIVNTVGAPTPQYCWPLLSAAVGAEVWVKHENHSPVGAFKLRGGLAYFDQLARLNREQSNRAKSHRDKAPEQQITGVVTATRGNHGQSVALAARRNGFAATVVVPEDNSKEKNAAIRALGAELIEFGGDFQSAREHAQALAKSRGLHMVPSFHPHLIAGVATYSLELLRAVADIDVAYVPIGMGSGICGMVAVRDALGLKTRIVGVVSAHAPAYALSFAARRVIEHATTTRIADGMACRSPDPLALAIICRGVERIVEVTDDEIESAMRLLFECTHNVSEGAGAAAVAALRQERAKVAGLRVAVVLSGGNVDRDVFARILATAHAGMR